MDGGTHFHETKPPGIPRWLFLFALILAGSLGAGISHAQGAALPSLRQAPSTFSTTVMSAAQEDRWREQEIQRYSPGLEKNLMDGKSIDYIKLVVAPLLLFILALAVVRLRDF